MKCLSAFLFLLLINTNSIFSQNGKILSKQLVDVTKTKVWNWVSQNGELKTEYKYLEQLNLYAITYQNDSLVINGFILEPGKSGKYPVVIFNRGGNRDFSALTEDVMISYTSKLASAGYIIIAGNYRKQDEFGGAEIHDVLCLTETIKEIDKADTAKVGMFGWSRGGMMTYLALKHSTKIKTAIVGNGPTNLFDVIIDRPEMETQVMAQCIPNYNTKKDSALKGRSAFFWPEKLCKESSLLILCGTKDRHVNPTQADKMAKKLTDINYNFVLKKFETDHFFTGKKNELNEEVIKWFDEKLKKGT